MYIMRSNHGSRGKSTLLYQEFKETDLKKNIQKANENDSYTKTVTIKSYDKNYNA